MRQDRLPRFLGPIGAALLAVGWTIGSGIFRVPGQVAAGAGSISASLLLWGGGGLVALCGALCYAELSVRLPHSGGEYVYLRAAFGPFIGFLMAWSLLLAAPMAVAAVARAFADYFAVIWPLAEMPRRILAAGMIGVLAGIAVVSTPASTRVAAFAAVGKLLALLALAVTGLWFTSDHVVVATGSQTAVTFGGLAPAFIGIMWAYDGYSAAALLAGEVRNPQRTLPIGLMLGLGFVATAYVGTNVVYFHVLGYAGVAASDAVAAQTLAAAIGPRAAQIIAVLVMASTLGTVAAQCVGQPRYFLAPAEDGLLPGWLARVSPSLATPANAVIALAGAAMLAVVSGGYSALIGVVALVIYPFMALALLGAAVLRRKYGPPTGFSMPLYPLPLIVYVGSVIAILAASVADDPMAMVFALGAPVTGSIAYYVGKRRGAFRAVNASRTEP